MNRRKFIALLGVAAMAWALVAHAQEPKKIPHLCFLTFDPGTFQSRSPRFDVFFNSLRDLGYVDGQTIVIHYLSADGKDDRFPALASECLRLKVDIIAVSTTPAAQAAKRATRTVPIVMIALRDPVGTSRDGGLIAYAVDSPDLQRNAARYVDKMSKVATPSHLPMQQPAKLRLVINLKAANAIGLKLPPSLLTRADAVIE